MLQRAQLKLVAIGLFAMATLLLVAALVIALTPSLGAAGACALVGALLALSGGALTMLGARPQPPASTSPPATTAPPVNPWVSVFAHAAAVGIVSLTNRLR